MPAATPPPPWVSLFVFNFGLFSNVTARPWHACLAFFLHSTSLMLFLGVGRRMFKASANDVAVTLKTFVVVWITEDLVALPYTLFLPLVWLPHVPEWYWMASEIMFAFERSVSCNISIAVFFLTLDRCVTLSQGLRYRVMHGKLLCAICWVLMLLSALTELFLSLYPYLIPPEEYDPLVQRTCGGYWCILSLPGYWQFAVRTSFGTLNVMCSLFFAYSLNVHYAKQAGFSGDNGMKNSANTFIAYAIASDMLLSFVPHCSCLMFEVATGAHISNMFGSWTRLLTSFDAFLCAFMYYRRMNKVQNAISPAFSASTNIHSKSRSKKNHM